MRRQKTGHRKRSGALSRRESLPPAYADTRASPLTKEQNRMIPRFSGIRHVFDKMYKNLSAGLWSPAPRDADAIATFSGFVYSPYPGKQLHKPRNTLRERLQLLDFAHIFAHLRFEIGKSHLTNNGIPISR